MVHRKCVGLVVFLLSVGCAGGSERGEDLRIQHVHGLGVASGGALFVATHHGLFVRDGSGWSRRSSDRADHMGFSLVSDRLMFRSGHPETGGSLGVERSTDGGRKWKSMSDVLSPPADFHAMTAGRGGGRVLYGWDSGGRGLFRSTGDGKDWRKVAARGLPGGVGSIAVSSSGDVYGSTNRGLLRSADGEAWEPVSGEPVFALAFGGRDPEVLYASRQTGPRVARSKDGGATWEDAGGGLEEAATIIALAASADGPTVLAADAQAGIWRSEDGAATWSKVPTP